jgi:hypothetical protein
MLGMDKEMAMLLTAFWEHLWRTDGALTASEVAHDSLPLLSTARRPITEILKPQS